MKTKLILQAAVKCYTILEMSRLKLVLSLLTLLFCLLTKAQEHPSPLLGRSYYNSWVVTLNQERLTGVLYQSETDRLILYRKEGLSEVGFDQIKKLQVRREHRILRSSAVGAGLGLIAGIAFGAGVKSSYLFTAEETAALYRRTFPVMGALAGVVVGAIRVKIPIQTTPTGFVENKRKLTKPYPSSSSTGNC